MYYWNEFIKDIRSTLKPGDVLLDAGAGDCHWKDYFTSEIKYIGMDLGVGDSQQEYSRLDIRGDLKNIPLENQSVDAIISIEVLEHLPEPWKVMNEFNRVLKPGGYLWITCPQAEHQHQIPYDFFRYTPFGLRSLLETNGFNVIWIKPQLGNFYHIGANLVHSAQKLPKISNNQVKKIILSILSIYLRLMWKIHKSLLEYFDQFEQFQDNCIGHFVMARKL